jgi:putative hydrolase of the HAD superfamily
LCKIGKADIKKVLKNYLPSWGWKKSTAEFLDYWFKFDSALNKQMIEDVKNLREKGINCYLATNNEKYRVEYLTNILGFKNIFNGVFSSDKIGYHKTQQKFWQVVYDKLKKIKKENVLCWDDDEKNIEAIKKFGFCAEFYTGFDNYKNKINYYLTKN